MAQWFHRNPLKATSVGNFELPSSNGKSQTIIRLLKDARYQLLTIISDPNSSAAALEEALKLYTSLLHGLCTSCDPNKAGLSKLRYLVKFRWTDTLTGTKTTDRKDAIFEQISMLFNAALWHTKHASRIASKDDPSMEIAKDVHKSLRIAAGIFMYIKDDLVAHIEEKDRTHDLDSRILSAYTEQTLAEAQEVTIARAIEMKHSPNIIASLAYETSNLFQSADDSLLSMGDPLTLKWQKYLQFKKYIYLSYAYTYYGEKLLADDKCGEAVCSLETSGKYYKRSEECAAEYSRAKGSGSTVRPVEHLFFRRLAPIIKRLHEKCKHENSFIYHHKVPTQIPELQLKAEFGLVKADAYVVPEAHSSWTAVSYNAFNVSDISTETGAKVKPEDKKDLPAVKEDDISTNKKDASNNSGCVLQ